MAPALGEVRALNIKQLRLLTVVGPIVYLVAASVINAFVLHPLLNTNWVLRLVIFLLLLSAGVVPFSFWVFATLDRQQSRLRDSAQILQNVRDYAIFALDPEGRVTSWSPEAERIKGYTENEILGHHVREFYLTEDRDAGTPERVLRDAARLGRVEDEGWRVRKDGSIYWATVVSSSVTDEAGRLTGYTHVVRDITDRKRAEDRIRTLNAELERRVQELAEAHEVVVRRNRELAAVNRAVTSISGALDLEDTLQNIVDAARSLVDARYAALGVADASGHILQFITSGLTDEQRAAIGPLPQGHGLLGVLIKEGRPLRISPIAHDPRSSGFPPNHPPMESLLGVPILFKGAPVGDLYLTDKIGAGEFSAEDQELLVLLSGHAAVAIENARLYEQVREARDRLQVWSVELEAKVADRTAEIARYSKELTTRVLQAQEEERKRISRELHDDTAQSLSTLLINLDLIEPQVPADNAVLRAGFDRTRALAKRTLDAVRALSHALRPSILDDFGLVAALNWYRDEIAATYGLPVDVLAQHVPSERLASDLELALFRIAQEALTNSAKYSGADHARATLSFEDSRIRLTIEDDGIGFDPDTLPRASRSGGLGLYGMRERADLIGADLTIQSAPGAGTTITVVRPFSEDDMTVAPQPAYARGASQC